MATNNYTISFKSLRSGRDYTITIGGGSGNVALKGAAQPFTTREDGDEDIFMPIRTQSGYIRIVDDGKDANGNAWSNWADLIPSSDTERPVKLSHVESGSTVIDWQGFMQTQTFDGPIYSGPTEREFPVQCVLSALDSEQVDTSITISNTQYHVCNFFMLLYQAFSKVSSKVTVGNFYIQGGNDAFVWLKSKFDWQNLLKDTDGTLTASYSYMKALEDMCRFWGFSLRTSGKDIYMTMKGASDVTTKLTMTLAQILTVATGGTAGSATSSYYTSKSVSLAFASTEQQETFPRGYNKVIVKADCNPTDIGVDFNAQAVKDAMGSSWRWSGQEGSQVGFFYTYPPKTGAGCINTDILIGSAVSQKAQFMGVQIYGNEEDTTPVESNVIDILTARDETVFASLETARSHRFGVGSIEMTGDIYWGPEKKPFSEGKEQMGMRIGIGQTRATAKWFYLKNTVSTVNEELGADWYDNAQTISVYPKSGSLAVGTMLNMVVRVVYTYAKFPTKSGLEGKLFIDFLGSNNLADGIGETFMIANFKVKFTRDTVTIPNTLASAPQARVVSKKRQSQYEYTDSAWGKNDRNWSADCIYASDNDMEHGLGLLMDASGNWLEKAAYGGVQYRPEEHLAAAVKTFWQTSHHMKSAELLYNSVGDVRPNYNVSFDGGTYHPVAVSHEWRDDIIKLELLSV